MKCCYQKEKRPNNRKSKGKPITSCFLFIYILTVLWFTIVNRTFGVYTARFELLWSYKAWFDGDLSLGWEILANIAMFIPFGFLLSSIFSKRRIIIPVAILFSLSIETLQFFLMRGLFEWDDLVSNTIGACAGILLFLAVDKLIPEKHREIIMKSLLIFFMIACVVVIIREHGGAESDNTSRVYCFQVDRVEYTDGKIELDGFAFRYEHPDSDYTLLLLSENGTLIKLEKESIARPDVNRYFSCDYDYTVSGFTARGTVEEGEYEVLIKWPWSIALSTGVYIDSSIHYVPEKEFTAPEIGSDFVENGILRVYRPDYHCWVYQWNGALYWVVDQDFYFEDNGLTYIQYQMWTTQPDNLPQNRLENNWLWDNIGGNFEDYELQGDWNGYRVMKRDLPTAYSITSIVTGYYQNGEWIWKEYFRPYYDF